VHGVGLFDIIKPFGRQDEVLSPAHRDRRISFLFQFILIPFKPASENAFPIVTCSGQAYCSFDGVCVVPKELRHHTGALTESPDAYSVLVYTFMINKIFIDFFRIGNFSVKGEVCLLRPAVAASSKIETDRGNTGSSQFISKFYE